MSSWKKKLRKVAPYIGGLALAGTVGQSANKKKDIHGIFNPANIKSGSNVLGKSVGGLFTGLFSGFKQSAQDIRQGSGTEATEVQEENAARQNEDKATGTVYTSGVSGGGMSKNMQYGLLALGAWFLYKKM